MSTISAFVVIVALTFSLLYDIRNKNDRFWSFVIFFQHIPLIIFDQLGNELIGVIYFVIMILLFYIRSPKLIKKKTRFINPIAISIALVILSLLIHYFVIGIDPDNIRGYETFNRVLIFNVPIILLCLFSITSNDEMLFSLIDGILLYGFFFIVTILFVTGLVDYGVEDRGAFREDFRISPLTAAKSAGIIIIATAFKIINEKRYKTIIISFSIMIISFTLLFITASRAALMFLFLAIAYYYSFSKYHMYKKLTIISLSVLFIIVMYIIILQLNLPLIQRLEALQNYDQMLRFTRLEIVIEMVKNFEMGWMGLGPYGFGYLTGLNYPHNYIAELIVDYGIIGLISVSMIVGYGFFYSYKLVANNEQKNVAFIGILFLYLFLTSLTSGDVFEARQMHFVGILLANTYFYYKKHNTNKS